jgi:transposase-like protein
MATKGQKMRKYTNEFKEKVILEKIEKGRSYGYLAEAYEIPEGTIITWVYEYKKNIGKTQKKIGRPKKETDIDYKERYEILKKFQDYLEVVEHEKR